MKFESGPIVLGTVVLEKLGAVRFDNAFMNNDGVISVMGRNVEEAIQKETNFNPAYMMIAPDDDKGNWELRAQLDTPSCMALDYPEDIALSVSDSEMTLALNILYYGLDEPFVREALGKWAVKRLGADMDELYTKGDCAC